MRILRKTNWTTTFCNRVKPSAITLHCSLWIIFTLQGVGAILQCLGNFTQRVGAIQCNASAIEVQSKPKCGNLLTPESCHVMPFNDSCFPESGLDAKEPQQIAFLLAFCRSYPRIRIRSLCNWVTKVISMVGFNVKQLRFGSILPTGHKSNCEIHLKKVKSCSCFPELPVSRLNATELQLS